MVTCFQVSLTAVQAILVDFVLANMPQTLCYGFHMNYTSVGLKTTGPTRDRVISSLVVCLFFSKKVVGSTNVPHNQGHADRRESLSCQACSGMHIYTTIGEA